MNRTAHINDGPASAAQEDEALQARVIRIMAAAVVLAAIISALISPWRVTTGLLLGGVLALFNHHWMSGSTTAILSAAAAGGQVGPRAARYLLRYVVIGGVVFAAYELRLISLPATIIGLCSFVAALFAEAFRQFYFSIVHREGIN